MATENDVPLGESRKYYEQQFGDRIRQVRKSGGGGGRSTGGSGWSGRAGIGVVIGLVALVMRIVVGIAGRSDSSTPSYTYTPPPQVQWDKEQQKAINDILQQKRFLEVPDAPGEAKPGQARTNYQLREEDDIPLLQGLCYRIHKESQQPGRTPGGRICQFLNAPARHLLARAAAGEKLDEDDREDLIDALNGVLRKQDFYDGVSFQSVNLPADLVWDGAVIRQDGDARGVQRFNRTLLEKCYPEQIVPVSERNKIPPGGGRQWQERASKDLAAARRKYEAANR